MMYSSRVEVVLSSLYGPPVLMSFLDLVELWSTEQVADWLRGLDDSVLPYIHFFSNGKVDGPRLMMMTGGELEDMGISRLGVRQIITQALDLLSHLCYNLESENLQTLGMLVGVKAMNLLNDLGWIYEKQESRSMKSHKDAISSLNLICTGVSYLIEETKKIISWLDRSPFDRLRQYVQLRNRIMELTVKILRFTQVPSMDMLMTTKSLIVLCNKLYDVCDGIVKELNDPLILQTAFLERAVLRRKKSDQDLGLDLLTSYKGSHMITEVKFKSPADLCGKVDAGDEIVQFNGQTVIGWDLKKLVAALNQFKGTEIVLLLKKRPREFTYSGCRSQPGTPMMGGKKLVRASRGKKETKKGSTSSAESPGPGPALPRRLRKRDRKKSSSFTTLPHTFKNNPEPPPRKHTVPAKLEGPELPRIFSSDFPKLGLEGEEKEAVSVTLRQRRASVSGGSPILKRMSAHLSGRSLVCPRPQSQWIEIFQDSEWRKDALMERGGVGGGRKRLGRVPTQLRPVSFIDNELVVPPPLRVSLLSSATETTDSDMDTEDPHISDDDDVFLLHTPRCPVEEERREGSETVEDELSEFASIEVADLDEVEVCGLMASLDSAEWTGGHWGSHTPELDTINGNDYYYRAGPEWNDPGCPVTEQRHHRESTGNVEDLESSFVSSGADGDADQSFSAVSVLSADSRRKIEKFFGELPTRTDTETMEAGSPESGTTSGNWSLLSSGSEKVDLVRGGSGERMRGEVPMGERSSPVLTGIRPIGSTHGRDRKKVVETEGLGRGSRVDWKTLESESGTPCARVMGRGEGVVCGWVKRAPLSPGKWKKLWMVLAGGTLYMYTTKHDEWAECVLWLPEFIACPAEPEYRTNKKNVFKLYDSVTTFYFSCEDKQDMYGWLKKLGLAAISYGSQRVSRGSKKGTFYLSEEGGRRGKRERLSESPIFGTLPRSLGKSRSSPSAGELFSSLRKSLRTGSPRKSGLNRENSTGSNKSGGSLDGRPQVSDPLKPRKISAHP